MRSKEIRLYPLLFGRTVVPALCVRSGVTVVFGRSIEWNGSSKSHEWA